MAPSASAATAAASSATVSPSSATEYLAVADVPYRSSGVRQRYDRSSAIFADVAIGLLRITYTTVSW